MNIYTAIMRAADHIERNPKLFGYKFTEVPECGSPGCLVGHIGAFMGYAPGTPIYGISNGDCSDVERWSLPETHYGLWEEIEYLGGYSWFRWDDAPVNEVAHGLRLYAEKYHNHQKPKTGIPQEIRDIFKGEAVEV